MNDDKGSFSRIRKVGVGGGSKAGPPLGRKNCRLGFGRPRGRSRISVRRHRVLARQVSSRLREAWSL